MPKTPLYEKHLSLQAQMVDFHGWLMPLQYRGIVAEHLAVRNKVGVFDVSHMGVIEISGSGAYLFLQELITNNLDKIRPGRALYTPLCLSGGGIIDDLIVYMLTEQRFLLVVNASNKDKDYQWLLSKKHNNIRITDRSPDYGLLAVQGPLAANVIAPAGGEELRNLKRFHLQELDVSGRHIITARTGYSGEDGFEVFIPREETGWFWERLFKAGADFDLQPIGLGARDTLRLEKGYLLYGNDIDETTTPLEAGIGWTVDFSKDGFCGKEALLRQQRDGIFQRLVLIEMIDRGIPRPGCRLWYEGEEIGRVTSGTFGPSLNKGIALAYLKPAYAVFGQEISVLIRGHLLKATVTGKRKK